MSVIMAALDGGPCAGKTTAKLAVAKEFGDRIVFVPEVATALLESGLAPLPGRDLPWSQTWQDWLERQILGAQVAAEEMWRSVALHKGASLVLCDRGLLSCAAYLPGGVQELAERFGVDIAGAHARYRRIIHLESLATANPSLYGKAGNASRFEPLERAQELELATRAAWEGHPGRDGLEAVVATVLAEVRALLAEADEA